MASKLTVLVILELICVSGAQLESSVERPCPGETVTFTCTVSSLAHVWEVPILNISRNLVPTNQEGGSPPFQFTVTAVMTGSITSTATVTATENLNGTLVLCRDGLGTLPDNQNGTINLRNPPTAPETPSVSFPIPGQQFDISWDEPLLSMGGTIDTYFVNISGPNDLCGSVKTLQRVTERSYTCSGWTMPTGQNYTFTVAAANCGGNQRGPDSDSITVCLQAPNPPSITVTPLYDSSGHLLKIESQATAGSPVTIADGVDSSLTEYIFFYQNSTGSRQFPVSATNPQHTFRVTSSQAQQYTVSVAARNVVGVGNASTPVTVGSVNNLFNVTVDVGVREVTCQFLNDPVSFATCTIQYGTDPTYVNLPNTDSSTGTNVNNVTVPLSATLQADTVYYYVVSSMGVQMQGTFHSGCALADLAVVDTTPDERCIGLLQNSAQFTGGAVCYSGVTPGSIAVYICNSSHCLEGPSLRECQSNGNWSDTVPQCVADPAKTNPDLATAGLTIGAVVGISITIFLVSFSAGTVLAALITYCCCMRRRRKSSGQPHLTPSEGAQPAPVYDEVGAGGLELKENVAYGPVDALEMKQNPSYGPVGH